MVVIFEYRWRLGRILVDGDLNGLLRNCCPVGNDYLGDTSVLSCDVPHLSEDGLSSLRQ